MKSHHLAAVCLATVTCIPYGQALAQQLIKVSQPAWQGLNPVERELIQKSYLVSMVEQDSFGVIIDNQGVNESTPGTNGGAVLGGALANAAYVDNAFRSRNYSAVNQLAAGIFGAVLGSALDSKPNAQFHYRYAVKLGSGNIQYFDETKSDPFRHPAGVCVSVPNIALIDQQLCSQTAELLRTTYLRPAIPPPSTPPPMGMTTMPPPMTADVYPAPQQSVSSEAAASPALISCKLGTLAPVRTSPEKCQLIKGSQVP